MKQTPKETFIENCKKLVTDKHTEYRVIHFGHDFGGIQIKRGEIDIVFYPNPTEHQLRQLIYHEFGYDVEMQFFSDGVSIIYLWNYAIEKSNAMEIIMPFNPDLSHWIDGLIEVFNKLMQEREQ